MGKGPWSSEVSGIVKIGQTMTMVLGIKDEENKFDMLVRYSSLFFQDVDIRSKLLLFCGTIKILAG